MSTLVQPTDATERRLAALELVRDRVTDEDRRVIAPRHMFETEDGLRRTWGEIKGGEPCRACLAGWACYAESYFGFADDSIQFALERACEVLSIPEDEDDTCRVTRATRDGAATLNEVIDKARELVSEQAKRARVRGGIDALGRLGILGGLGT